MRFTCQALFGGAAETTATVRTTDDPVIREIHARTDIVAFIGQYVQLKKRGHDFVGLCPFHGEKTPSFHVHPDPDNFFKCFGCGVGGDVITFLRRLENVSFGDAKRMLAARAGIEIEPENPRTARQRSERESIYEANRIAAGYFARMLKETAGRTRARVLREARIQRVDDREVHARLRAGFVGRFGYGTRAQRDGSRARRRTRAW